MQLRDFAGEVGVGIEMIRMDACAHSQASTHSEARIAAWICLLAA